MSRQSQKARYIEEVKRLYVQELRSLSEISQTLGPSVQTLSRWLGEEGIELAARPRDPNAGRSAAEQAAINERIAASQRARVEAGGHHGGRSRAIERETRPCANTACMATFEVPVTSPQRFCGMTCARSVGNKERWADKRNETACPCGVLFYSPYAKKYHSDECRKKYAPKRQKDPANYITFTCLNQRCGKEVTRRKGYSQYAKYCSNECAAKHTKTKQHIVVDDAIVLDSPYEAFFWGLCSILKIPVERADRGLAVQVNGNGWYCPDFWLPGLDLWVEVKGVEDEDDPAKWDAWRASGCSLVVLRREELHELRTMDRDNSFTNRLHLITERQNTR